MKEWLTAIFMVGGALFMFLSALGILRLPDTYIRMHALTKAGTFGVVGVMISTIVHFRHIGTLGPALLVIIFFLVTIPVAGQLLVRAAYFSGVPKWKRTRMDELAQAQEEVGEDREEGRGDV
jgi:multicomponent Na+:H+ antiporter subunit G